MASTILQVRIDDSLRRETNEIFRNLGLDMSSAVRLFLNRVVVEQGLPFSMTLRTENSNETSFNAERRDEDSFNVLDYLNLSH